MNNMNFMNDKRVLVLSGEINEKSAEDIIAKLNIWNIEDQISEDTYKDSVREPIMLLINSVGGDVYSSNAIIAAIEMSVSPVVTIAVGCAASAAFTILLAGHERYAHRFASVMYHDTSYYGYGKTEDHKRTLEHVEQLGKMYDSYVLERTSITQDKLDQVKKDLRDWYISTDDLVKYGIVSEVI